jgi:histone deacetylase 1/2
MENANSKEYLEKIKVQVIENLKKTAHAPSVQLTDVPRTTLAMGDLSDYDDELDDLDEDLNADERVTMRMLDQRIARDDELDESDVEEEGMNGTRSLSGSNRRRNIMDYQNPNAVADDIEVDKKVETPELGNGVDEKVSEPSTEAKAEVNDTVMEENDQSATAAEVAEDEPSTAPSRSSNPAVDNDGDVDMDESAPEPPVQVPTPTSQAHSPPAAAAAATAVAAAPTSVLASTEETPLSQDPADVKQEGEDEREEADVTGEASAEIAQQSQT